MLVYQLGQTTGYTPDPGDIVHAGPGDSLQPAELAQQLAPPLGADAGDTLQG